MKKVIIYSSRNCSNCTLAKKHLEERGVEFEVRDVKNKDYRNELLAMGYMGVPLIIIGGKEIFGFNPQEIDKALEA